MAGLNEPYCHTGLDPVSFSKQKITSGRPFEKISRPYFNGLLYWLYQMIFPFFNWLIS